MKKLNIVILVLAFLVFHYTIYYFSFVKKDPNFDQPILKERFGTIMWHSSYGPNEHVYCYYPKSSVQFPNKKGEYIIKKVEVIDECKDWLGVVLFKEEVHISERDKIIWNEFEVITEDLVPEHQPS